MIKEILTAITSWLYLALFGIAVGIPFLIVFLAIGYFLPDKWYGHIMHLGGSVIIYFVIIATVVPNLRDWKERWFK